MSLNSHSKRGRHRRAPNRSAGADSPRKLPRQERAQATVEAILRATAHILRTKGWDACNTNAVAKRAGVSIGSLYQYFPSKEALIAALAERHAQEGLKILVDAVADARTRDVGLGFEETVRHYISAMVTLHAHDPELHRVLVEQVPRLHGGQEVIRRTSMHAGGLVRAWLETQKEHVRGVDLDVATYMLVTAVEAIQHLQVVEKPEKLTREVLIDELVALVLGYLGVKRR
jgi:AcrR family transcriptional regulator